MAIGISKRALMEDYYFDEFSEILAQWAELHGWEREEAEELDVSDFLAM